MADPSSHTCHQCGLVYVQGGVRLRSGQDELRFCCSGCAVTNSVLGTSSEEGESALFLARLGFSGFLAMNIMAVSWMVYDRGLVTFGLTSDVLPAFEALLFILSLPVMLLIGVPYAIAAWKELRALSISADSLIAVGSFSAFAYSTWQLFVGGRGIYYDTATMTLVLVTLGRYVEATAKGRAHRSLRALLELQPSTARVVRDASEEITHASEVSVGELVRVLAGERFPLDGYVVDGIASVDESTLTGESLPRTKGVGDRVLAATLNLDGSVLVRVSSASSGSAHAQAVQLLEEARTTRSPIQRTVDRISGIFLPLVIVLALGSILVWSFVGPLEEAILTGLTVLVVSCPCALGIGTPLALTYALQRAASEGVLVRTHAALERLTTIRNVLFDKTGTLTSGRPSVRAWFSHDDGDTVRSVLASLESHSTHPVARGIVRSSGVTPDAMFPVRNVRILPGKGIQGDVEIDRVWEAIGIFHSRDEEERLRFMDMASPDSPPMGDESEVYAYKNGRPYAFARIADTLREDAAAAVESLHASSYTTALVSGDDRRVVDHVAMETHVQRAQGELLPGDKLETIRASRRTGPTAMVGDGINDAPSLAAADVGIAMAGGTDIAKESADVIIVGDRLSRIPWLLRHAQRTMSIVRWNLFWAFGYNIIAIALALGGILQPVFAAAAMVLSSVSIIAHSARAGSFSSPSEGSDLRLSP